MYSCINRVINKVHIIIMYYTFDQNNYIQLAIKHSKKFPTFQKSIAITDMRMLPIITLLYKNAYPKQLESSTAQHL